MTSKLKRSFHRWCFTALALTAVSVSLAQNAEANSLYWRRYSPSMVGPGPVFISPVGNIWNGGWWMSSDLGRAPLSICRVSDGPFWAYGSYFNGNCSYFSTSFNRGHSISIGFDLMGGSRFPNWRPIAGDHHHPYDLQDDSWTTLGDPTLTQQQSVLDSELSTLCRIQQAEGAFIGTLRDQTCYAAWNGQTLISAEFEVVENEEN